MYKSLTKNDYQKMLKLPNNYQIDGVLSYGHYDLKKQLDRLKKSLSNLNIDYQITQLNGYLQNILEIKTPKSTFWFAVVYGGVTLGEYLHFACLFGSKKNIHIGSCGGLYPQMNSLDYLVPIWSYGNESSTRFYARNNTENIHYPNKGLSDQLKAKLVNERAWEGPVITCAAMVAETKGDVDKWTKKGYYGVEMETSTIFAVSNHFDVPSAALLYVSDNLVKGEMVGDENHNKQKEIRYQRAQKMLDVAVEVLLN